MYLTCEEEGKILKRLRCNEHKCQAYIIINFIYEAKILLLTELICNVY